MVEEIKKRFKELQAQFNELFSIKPKESEETTAIVKYQEPFFKKLTSFSENLATGFENLQKKFVDDVGKLRSNFLDFQSRWEQKIKELEAQQAEKNADFKKKFDEWNKQNKENWKEGLDFWNKTGWKLYFQFLIGTIPVILIIVFIFWIFNVITPY